MPRKLYVRGEGEGEAMAKAARKETVGISPKAPAAAAAALLAPLVARLVAQWVGVEVDDETVEGLLLAAIAGLGGLAGAYVAPPGAVTTKKKGA